MKNIFVLVFLFGIPLLFSCTKSDTAASTILPSSCSFPATGITQTVTYGAWTNSINSCGAFDGSGVPRWTGMSGNVALVAVPPALYAAGVACGTCLSITGAGGTTWVGRVIDTCPTCAADQIDMDATAFEAITGTPQVAGSGVVSATAIPCPSSENVKVTMESGSNAFYFQIALSNHVTPIETVELDLGSGFQPMTRVTNAGWFESNHGFSASGTQQIRITDAFDQIITGSFDPGVSSTTLNSQFGTCP